VILASFNHLIYQKGRDYAYETNTNRTVQGRKKQRNTDGIEVMRHLTGIDVKFVRRLAIAPSNLAYSSERTIAIIRSSSVSLLWLLIEVELDEAPSLGNMCVISNLEDIRIENILTNDEDLNVLEKILKSSRN